MRTLIEDWISTQYGTAPSEADYRTEHFQRYAVANVQMDRMFRYARRWATGVGADFFYLPYVQTHQNREAPETGNDKYRPMAVWFGLETRSIIDVISALMYIWLVLASPDGKDANL